MKINIEKEGDWSSTDSKILEAALFAATEGEHKLPYAIFQMEGMSGHRYKILINKLIEITPDARYLEIGSWKGSTACAAGYKNKVNIVCIDNWYQDESVKETFIRNTATFLSEDQKVLFDHADFRDIDYNSIGKFNVYLFDGPHEYQDQYDGIKIVQPALDDVFTLIVDDYNASQVRDGTLQAIKDLNLTVIASVTITTDRNPYLEKTDWHNGYYIAVIKKENK